MWDRVVPPCWAAVWLPVVGIDAGSNLTGTAVWVSASRMFNIFSTADYKLVKMLSVCLGVNHAGTNITAAHRHLHRPTNEPSPHYFCAR